MTDAAIGIIFNYNKTEVLAIKRRDIPIWVLPGGGIDPGETPDDAVIREVKEETGYDVKVYRRTAEYTPLNKLAYFTVLFECEIIGGAEVLSNETSDIGFYPIKNLPTPFFHVHEDWIKDALCHPNELYKSAIYQVTYWKLVKYFLRHPLFVMATLIARLRR